MASIRQCNRDVETGCWFFGQDEDFNRGVWFQAQVSGMFFRNPKAAGDIASVRVDGVKFVRMTTDQPHRLEVSDSYGPSA